MLVFKVHLAPTDRAASPATPEFARGRGRPSSERKWAVRETRLSSTMYRGLRTKTGNAQRSSGRKTRIIKTYSYSRNSLSVPLSSFLTLETFFLTRHFFPFMSSYLSGAFCPWSGIRMDEAVVHFNPDKVSCSFPLLFLQPILRLNL